MEVEFEGAAGEDGVLAVGVDVAGEAEALVEGEGERERAAGEDGDG